MYQISELGEAILDNVPRSRGFFAQRVRSGNQSRFAVDYREFWQQLESWHHQS